MIALRNGSDMSPIPLLLDLVDASLRDAKECAHMLFPHAKFKQPSNNDDVDVGQLGATRIHSSWGLPTEDSERMDNVFLESAPLKVFQAVIGFVSVFVVHLVSPIRGILKRLKDYSMNSNLFSFRAFVVQADNKVSTVVESWSHEFYRKEIPSHPSSVAHAVNSFVSFDWTPFLSAARSLCGHFRPFCSRLICLGSGGVVSLPPAASKFSTNPSKSQA